MFGIERVNKLYKQGTYLLLFSFLFIACSEIPKQAKGIEDKDIPQEETPQHFQLTSQGTTNTITVIEPFLGSKLKENYLLYPRNNTEPSTSATHKIAVPVKKIAIHSTTHIGFLSELGQLEKVRAASNLSLYYDSAFNARIKMDSVQSIGNRSLDIEALINSEVDVIFSFVIDAAGMKEVEKLRALGQKVILVSEYMENSPLNKAEWIKVFAAFFDEKTQFKADSIFNSIKQAYNATKSTISLSSYIPSVMIGFPWKGTWYVSGGNSYQAQLIRDANALYPWSEMNSSASIPLTLEKVYEKALMTDVWINPGSKLSYNEILEENKNFDSFEAFKKKRIYTNYKRTNEFGANDYWESGVVHPERILKDLAQILHSDAVQENELYYYRTLK